MIFRLARPPPMFPLSFFLVLLFSRLLETDAVLLFHYGYDCYYVYHTDLETSS